MDHYEAGLTALVVNVPAAEPVVGRWRERYDSSATYGVSAHVTVLYPFLRRDRVDAEVESELRRLFAAFGPFDVTFRTTGRFPGVLYLAPEPAGPLRALTEAVWRRWPEAPPYGGRYPDAVPHLTVADSAPADAFPEIEADLAAGLPFTARAGEVMLVAYDGTAWRSELSFPLGGEGRADGDYGRPGSLAEVLADVAAERVAQDVMFGIQDPADGTGGPERTAAADHAKAELERAARAGEITWRHILHEEVLEAFAESDPDRLRAELIQVAAVAVKWAQALGGRGATAPHQVKKARFKAIVDVHVLLVRDGKLLLGRRANTGYADGLWHLPSGHLEAGESAVEGAVREAREEVGVAIDPADLTFVHAMHRAPDRVGLFFRAERWDGEPYNAEPGKCDALEWHPLDRLPDGTVDYPGAAIRAIGEGHPFAQFGF
ncbi:2'-5' RNA ligase family protein [Nonomuraea sp. NPDC049152]|uniref:2'-5' RNA ligase family protein n=1 Tax=Nonomuraea sp. NPDC049152 TaxID=3154350 RepID=UPI0033C4F15E